MSDRDRPGDDKSWRKAPVWMKILGLIGLLTVGGVVLDMFVGFGRRPELLHTSQAPPAGSPDFLRAVAGSLGAPLGSGGTAAQLNNGDAFYPALLEAIRGARSSINFSVYIWDEGQPNDAIVPALAERARAGVPVRVLLDGFGGKNMPEASHRALEAAGVHVRVFRPLRFGMLTRFHRRNHRRAIVIDGTTAFTGGMAVAEQWLGHAQDPEHWRDTMFKLTGPPATLVQSAFADVWAYSTGELLAGDPYFPQWPAAPAEPPPGAGAGGAGDPFVHVGLASAPSKEDHPMGLLFLLTFAGSRQRLYVATPYFMPDRSTRRALAERARAGVDVRLLLPNEHTDAAPVRLASQRNYEELLEAGVRIYEYQPTFLHSKTVVVDGVWSVIGSANLNVRSRELDHENVVAVANRGLAGSLEQTFMADLQQAREITLPEWRRRGRWQRLKEWACSALAQVS